MIANKLGACRKCAPGELARIQIDATRRIEDEKAASYFRYFMTVKKKDRDLGDFAKAFLADKPLSRLMGLENIRLQVVMKKLDPTILERAWAASECERRAAENGR